MTLDTPRFGKPLKEWAAMTEADRLAALTKMGHGKKIATLNQNIAEALAVKSTTEVTPPAPAQTGDPAAASTPSDPTPRADDPAPADVAAIETVDIQAGGTTSTHSEFVQSTVAEVAESLGISPTELEVGIDPAAADDMVSSSEPFIAKVLREVAVRPVIGNTSRTPEPHLTPQQAEFQARLFDVLHANDVLVRRHGDVYGWLLDQFAVVVGKE